jgi:ParB/RepB/Spo0J family partition protein
VLVAGERRLLHAEAAGLNAVPVVIVEAQDRLTHLLMEAHENLHRRDFNPLDVARYLRALKTESGWTDAEVAERCGMEIPRSQVTQYLKLLGLGAEAQEAVLEGLLGFSAAREVSRLNDHPALQDELVAEIRRREGLSVRSIKDWVDRALVPTEELVEEREEQALSTVASVYADAPEPVLEAADLPAAVRVEATEVLEAGADPLAVVLLAQLEDALDGLLDLPPGALQHEALQEAVERIREKAGAFARSLICEEVT